MVRKYQRKLGARNYKNYSEEALAKAVAEVRAGILTQVAASKKYKINRTTILNKIHHRHEGKPGHPTVLTPETEKIIADTLQVLTDRGIPLTKSDIQVIVQMLVTREGRTIKQWKDNLPGTDFVNEFAARNNLTHRLATNIKASRASVGPNEIKEFFENVKPALEETCPSLIYNYDETNITDDPGAIKVLVPRGHKRVERVQEHSKSSVSIMFCGTADGNLIPPMVVYKSKHLYENWTVGGPPGTIYRNSHSGWFDMNLFEVWFFKILLPHIQEHRVGDQKAVVIGDNLASHFSPEVVKTAVENNIHFTTLTPNSFRATGLYPFDPQAVLKKLPAERSEETGRILDSCLLDFLKETRGYNAERIRHRRGKKVVNKPGAQLTITSQDDIPTEDDVPEIDFPTFMYSAPETEDGIPITEHDPTSSPIPSTSGAPPPAKHQTSSDEDVPLVNLVRGKERREKMGKKKGKDNNLCYICRCDYQYYRHSVDWICCITCKNWVCGMCNKGSTNPAYECVVCEDDTD